MLSFQPSNLGSIRTGGCDCMEWKNMEYKEQGEKYIWRRLFFASKPCITVRVGAAMLA